MRMRFAWFVFVMALALLGLSLWRGRATADPRDLLTKEERAWVAKHGKIRLAPDPAFPPIEFFDVDGKYRGITADLFKLISERLQVRFEFVHLKSWDEVLKQARARSIDGITAAQMTSERSKYLVFSRPIVDIPNVIIARSGARKSMSFETMGGMRVAVTKGYANAEYMAKQFPRLTVVEAPDDRDALKYVSFGEVDAAVVNLATASYLIEQQGLTNLRVVGDSGKRNELMIAARNDDPVLIRILDKGLASLTEDEKENVVRKWVHLGDSTRDMRAFWIWLGVVAAVVAAAMAVFVGWNHALRRQVQIRTQMIRSQNEQLYSQNRELEQQGELVQQAQSELQKLNAELEQRVANRTDQLEMANRELEAFAYSVSHDLRAPLRAVDGFSHALLEDYGDSLNDEAREFVGRIRVGAQRMAMLIDDLLKLSRINRAELHLEWTNVSEIAREIGAELQKSNPDRNVHFTVADTPVAMIDEALIRIALQNLLENAWKFTAKHKAANVDFGFTETGEGGAYYVRDDGAGFRKHDASNLFAPFQRLHSESEFQGTGIGLAIVNRVVRRHGGKIWAEAEVEKGATFHFTLHETPTVIGSPEGEHACM